MSGGYSRIRVNPLNVTGGARDAEKLAGKFDGGMETELSPIDTPLNKSPGRLGDPSTPGMHAVRIRDGYLLPDWGSEEVGVAAIDDIQALGTRQAGVGFTDDPEIFRVFFNGGVARFQLEVFNPPNWVAGADFPIGWAPNLNRRIPHETFFDEVIFAAGLDDLALWDGATITEISGVSGDYIAQFAERAIVLRAGGDFQRVRASVSGIITDFTGAGSVDRVLESRTTLDEVDALVALVPLTSDIAVLFRSQSIWRVNRTGNAANPLAFNQWIDGVGMPSSFGAQPVPGGIIFAGSDHYVYLLTESGLTQLGRLYTRPDEVLNGGSETIYIPATGEFKVNWKLGDIADQGVNTLDFLEYLRTGNAVWTFRDFASPSFGNTLRMHNPTVVKPQGIGTDTDPALLYSDSSSVFRFLVPTSGGATQAKVFGFWDSANLVRTNRFGAYSMKRLVVILRKFEEGALQTPTLSAFASTDGGLFFQEAQDSPKAINITSPFGHIRLAFHWDFQGAPATGNDIRFRVILSDGEFDIGLESWEAEIVDRGDQFIPAAGDVI